MPGLTSPCPVLWWGKPVLTCLPTPGPPKSPPGGHAPRPCSSPAPPGGDELLPRVALGRWELGAHPRIHTASRAAADARGRAGHQSAAASNLSGLSLQEAQQILNVSKLSPEEIQKVRPPRPARR